MKKLILLLTFLILAGCAEKEKEESTDWALSIQANTGTREQKQAKLSGSIRYILDGVENIKELPSYDLPTSAIMQFQADRVVEIKVDPVEYDYPVFFHLIRYENLDEIKWPEEAMDLETSRFLYARTDNLRNGFSAIPESNAIEIKRTLDESALKYGRKDYITREQVLKIFSKIAPEITFEENEGWVQTGSEKYDTDRLFYSEEDQNPELEFWVTSRKGEQRVESLEFKIIFPIGKYDQFSDLIGKETEKYIRGFLGSIIAEESETDWVLENIYTPLHSNHDGRILEVGDYLIMTYRIYWDYIEPVEHIGLLITTKP